MDDGARSVVILVDGRGLGLGEKSPSGFKWSFSLWMTGRDGLRLRYWLATSEAFSKAPSGFKWSLRGATMWLREAGKALYWTLASDLSGKGLVDRPKLEGRR